MGEQRNEWHSWGVVLVTVLTGFANMSLLFAAMFMGPAVVVAGSMAALGYIEQEIFWRTLIAWIVVFVVVRPTLEEERDEGA